MLLHLIFFREQSISGLTFVLVVAVVAVLHTTILETELWWLVGLQAFHQQHKAADEKMKAMFSPRMQALEHGDGDGDRLAVMLWCGVCGSACGAVVAGACGSACGAVVAVVTVWLL